MRADHSHRLVIVSNRLPVVLKAGENDWELKPGSGGLVTALAPVLSRNGGLWIGWPGTVTDEDISEPMQRFAEEQGYSLHPVYLSHEDVQGYYYGFSNEVLWPLLHGFHTRCSFEPWYWEKYQEVNRMFAREIMRSTREDDYIWIHDYHLLDVGAELKALQADRKCGFFLHIPFPSPEIFLKLPWRREILSGMLDFELVGFQTQADTINFLHCLRALCPWVDHEEWGNLLRIQCENRTVNVGCFPISIDFEQFEEQARSKEVEHKTAKLNLFHQDQQLILGVDRLDYTKGIPERLMALDKALSLYPELRGRISLLQLLVPSREEVAEYQALKEEIERMVGEINGRYTQPGWIPIHYLYRSLERQELVSFYQASGMALITPLWDGMNLVAKEYCVCNHREDGALILSEFAGAASQLYEDAILVNPYDVNGVAEAIRRGFYMHLSERQARMSRLRSIIRTYDIHFWLESFLKAAFEGQALEFPRDGLRSYLPKIG
ncbi:MAG: trehalose-6-phosphate synthase [Desulfohalobiaceae bacterium]|nr:trehalose-6-phosphate synthase [Desulfohalobiaceae bacterium]